MCPLDELACCAHVTYSHHCHHHLDLWVVSMQSSRGGGSVQTVWFLRLHSFSAKPEGFVTNAIP